MDPRPSEPDRGATRQRRPGDGLGVDRTGRSEPHRGGARGIGRGEARAPGAERSEDWREERVFRARREVRLLAIRPRSRGARRSLRTFPVVTLHPRFPFNVRLTGKTRRPSGYARLERGGHWHREGLPAIEASEPGIDYGQPGADPPGANTHKHEGKHRQKPEHRPSQRVLAGENKPPPFAAAGENASRGRSVLSRVRNRTFVLTRGNDIHQSKVLITDTCLPSTNQNERRRRPRRLRAARRRRLSVEGGAGDARGHAAGSAGQPPEFGDAERPEGERSAAARAGGRGVRRRRAPALRPARASPPRANRSHASPFPSARRDCRERDTRASAAGTAAAVVVASRRGRRGSETRRDSCAEKSCRDRARARDGRAGRRRAARDEDGPRERRAGEDEDGCRRERRARARGEEETVRARRPPPLPSPTAFDGRTAARFDPLAVARRPRALRSPSLAPRRPSNAVATSFPSIPTPFSRRRLDAGRPSLTTSPPALRHRRAAIPRVRLAPFVLFSRPPALNRDRPKEVKCPRVVVETYKDEKTGDQKKRSYVRGRPLGKGGFAVVYSMQDPSTGESFAAKARLYSRRSHYATLRALRAICHVIASDHALTDLIPPGCRQDDAREGTRARENLDGNSHPSFGAKRARRAIRAVLRGRRERVHPHGTLQQQDARGRREAARQVDREGGGVLSARDRLRRRAPARRENHPQRP
eukprot:30101-Pelagococcus_subviridis.AAC.2